MQEKIKTSVSSPMPNFTREWFESHVGIEPEEREVRSYELIKRPPQPTVPEPEHANAKALAPDLTLEKLSVLSLVELKDLWGKLFEAMKADGCTGFHATPDMDALDKLPSDEERERHWLIGVMGMLGANFRGEYEDVTESLL